MPALILKPGYTPMLKNNKTFSRTTGTLLLPTAPAQVLLIDAKTGMRFPPQLTVLSDGSFGRGGASVPPSTYWAVKIPKSDPSSTAGGQSATQLGSHAGRAGPDRSARFIDLDIWKGGSMPPRLK
jgi:hypothetical protein